MSPAEARAEARRILAERRFHGTTLPRPFHGVLSWLAEHLHFLHFLVTWWDWLGRVLGTEVLWVIVGAIVVAIAMFVASRLARRRVGSESAAAAARKREKSVDPADLEREADRAEKRGELEAALRLRFRAGLLRLGRAEVLPLRQSLRTYEARRILRSPRFDRLARDFDEVVYGERSPLPGDVEAAREEWPRLLQEVRG